jgi:alpha-1,2-mannosyltransferase
VAPQPLLRSWPPRVSAAVFGVFAAVNLQNARHKGGDFDVFVDAGKRLLEGSNPYADSGPGDGVIGPPFQALFFAPFAGLDALNVPLAEVCWYLLNLAALVGGAVLWVRALAPYLPGLPQRWSEMWRSPTVLLALAAIAFPAQATFEHQNMNALLLCLLGAAALALVTGRDSHAGVFIGIATALKAYPGLLAVYLALRGRWRAAFVAALTTAGLTAVSALRYGWHGGIDVVTSWLSLHSAGAWPIRVQNQSLYAWTARLSGVDPAPIAWWLLAIATVALPLVWVASRLRSSSTDTLGGEMSLAMAVAVLLSPIAWDHYWMLMFPAFVLVAEVWRHDHGAVRRGATLTFVVAAVLTSGLSRATISRHGLTIARDWGNSTLAALLLVAFVSLYLAWRPPQTFDSTRAGSAPV